jgi:hypothetical protein
MTPQEIVDYKRRWMGTARNETKIHSDYHSATRTWLKDHIRSCWNKNILVVRSYFYVLYDYTRQRNKFRVVELRRLVVDTVYGFEPLPKNWVYMNEEQKIEWLEGIGYIDLDDDFTIEAWVKEIA